MPSNSVHKTIAQMSDQELIHVIKVYRLREKIADTVVNPGYTGYLNREFIRRSDINRHKARIESLSSWLVIEIVQDVLDKFLSQKINLSIILGLGIFFNLLGPVVLPIWLALTVYLSSLLFICVISTSLRVNIDLQLRLDKSCQLEPEIQGEQVFYNIHANNPSKKIYSSLTYGESFWLAFKRYSFCKINEQYRLRDEENKICKVWDLQGSLTA